MSRKIVSIILVVSGLGLLAIFGYRFFAGRKPNAGLKIQTTPEALVFVDNVQLGQTPLEQVFRPGEISLKIIPTSTDSAMPTYQTKVQLNPRTFTVVHRDFGPTEAQTSGYIVTLEEQSSKEASLSILSSNPDTASVAIDGEPQGFTEVWIPSITPGEHQIVMSAPGFASRTIPVKAVLGHKLVINAKLGAEFLQPTPMPTLSFPATPSATPKVGIKVTPTGVLPVKPYVEIENTPTNFLRVRQKPSTSGLEVGQIKPGELYHLLDSQTGWYLIEVELSATSSGWISSQYATKVE